MTHYYKTVNINTAIEKIHGSVMVIYTGGTIGMDYDRQTGSLIPFDFERIIEKVPELKRLNIELTVLSFNELIDSSDVSPHHWLELARIIHDFYEDYDGFVILHGTDTMAYTASALSFLLRNLGKPVIMTGAQLPIGASRTDARENLITALEIASAKADGMALVPEVCIYFDHLLLRGNRAKKVQNFNFTAFESANYPPLAVAGIHVDYNIPLIRPYNGAYFKIHQNLDNRVAILKLFPGLGKAFVEPVLSNTNLRGLVLETFGSGNAPTAPWLLTLIKEVVESGVYVLNVTQCDGGSVTQGKYITSKHLADIGVLGGADLTTEAAVTKMMSILGNFTEPSQIKELLVTSIAGEMS
jgi:L-asparaginase